MKSDLRNTVYRFRKNALAFVKDQAVRLSFHNFLPRKKRLLIVKLDSIGDYLLFRNFLAAIKDSEKYRDHEVTLCGNSWWQSLSAVLDKKEVDHFIWVDYARLVDEKYLGAISRQIRVRRFETALTPTFSRSHFADTLVLQSGATNKIAPEGDAVNIHPEQKRKNDRKYSWLVPAADPLSFEFERNRNFFGQVLKKQPVTMRPHLPVSGKRRHRVIVCPGAKDAARQWSPRNFYELCLYVSQKLKQPEFIICGSAAESQIAEKIIQSGNAIKFTNLSGKITLVELADLIGESSLLLCNDSAPYHMAALSGTTLICLSNGNHYGRFCPYPAEYQKKHLEIFPKALSGISTERIAELQQFGSTLDIDSISVEEVIAQIEQKDFLNEIVNNHH